MAFKVILQRGGKVGPTLAGIDRADRKKLDQALMPLRQVQEDPSEKRVVDQGACVAPALDELAGNPAQLGMDRLGMPHQTGIRRLRQGQLNFPPVAQVADQPRTVSPLRLPNADSLVSNSRTSVSVSA